jgi:3-oxoacyl-[acyl-carrier-protein] synthase III
MAIEIIATGRAVPPRRVSNDELAKTLDTSDEWIRSHTGIGNRHIADDATAHERPRRGAAIRAWKSWRRRTRPRAAPRKRRRYPWT